MSGIRKGLAVAALAAATWTPARADDPVVRFPEIRGRAIVVEGGIAYVGRTRGLTVTSVSDPASPATLSDLDVLGTVTGVRIVGTTAYLAAGSRGLVMVNVEDPERPVVVGRFDTSDSVLDVEVAGEIAFLADDSEGLLVVDVGDPSRPSRRASFSTRNRVRSLSREGDRLLTAEGTAGARIFDVSRPESPRETARFRDAGSVLDVAVLGSAAVLATGKAGARGYRIGRTGDPVAVSTLDGPAPVRNVSVRGDGLTALSCGGGGIALARLGPDGALEHVSTTRLPRSYAAGRSWFEGDRLFVAADLAGLAVLDVANPAEPVVLYPRERKLEIRFP